jgi:short subunit dehydrogenase-like uncharacterized protein
MLRPRMIKFTTMKNSCLLYGATGYTGALIARLAREKNIPIVIAGRSESKLKKLAAELGFEYLVFDLDDHKTICDNIRAFKVVLHAAGPFQHTAQQMMKACIAEKVHYTDITGEIEVFEIAKSLSKVATEAEIMLLPGIGFDVVPTDCMAGFLHNLLPDATHLQLAFAMEGGRISHGTANTMAENLGSPGAIRINGRIVAIPAGSNTINVPFQQGKNRFCMSIPWGDVSTAYHSTGIPNIETYMAIKPSLYRSNKYVQRYAGFILRSKIVKRLAMYFISKQPPGPSEEERKLGRSHVWGKVWNDRGMEIQARYTVPEAYTFTAMSALHFIQKILDSKISTGFNTPFSAYGDLLTNEICGVDFEKL